MNERLRGRMVWGARHAPVHAEGRCYGRTDVDVKIPAEEAASLLLRDLPFAPPSVVFCSPSARCQDLAASFASLLGATLRVDPRLYELSFGRFEGRTFAEIEAHEPEAYGQWMGDWRNTAPPGGETLAELEMRVRAFVAELDPHHTPVLITHAGVWRALQVVVSGCSWDEAMGLVVPHLAWLSLELPP